MVFLTGEPRMQPSTHSWRANAKRRYSTEELAALLKVKAQTIRAGLCRHGNYQGMVPLKSRNRFLLWDADQADSLVSGEGVC